METHVMIRDEKEDGVEIYRTIWNREENWACNIQIDFALPLAQDLWCVSSSIRNQGRFDVKVKANRDIRLKSKGLQKQEDPYGKNIVEELTNQGIGLRKGDGNKKKYLELFVNSGKRLKFQGWNSL